MGLLEDALRDAFADQVRTAPTVDDPAGRAIGAAGRIRRRRAVAGTLAIVAGVVFASGAVAALRSGPDGGVPAGPSVTQTPSPRPVDVWTDDAILTVDGSDIPLRGLAPVIDVLRVPDGFLITRNGLRTRTLYRIDAIGTPTRLAEGERIVISSDGRRVAWSSGAMVSLGQRAEGRFTRVQQTGGYEHWTPVAFTVDGVVLSSGDGYQTRYQVWTPDRAQSGSTPRTGARGLTAHPDGTALFALIGTAYPCLGQLDPDSLATRRQACDLKMDDIQLLVPSPDGRWLVALASDRVDLYDLVHVWGMQVPTASWTIVAQTAAWVDAGSFVLNGHSELLRGRVDAPGQIDEIPVDVPFDQDVVPVRPIR
jgi:hypothetical protein